MTRMNQHPESSYRQQMAALIKAAVCIKVYRKQANNNFLICAFSYLLSGIVLSDASSGKGGMGDAGGGNAPGSGSAGRTGGTDDTDDVKTERTYTGETNDSDIQSSDDPEEYGGGASQASGDITTMHELKTHGRRPDPDKNTGTTDDHSKKGNASPNVDSGPINNDRGA